jgi:hypothetical protein
LRGRLTHYAFALSAKLLEPFKKNKEGITIDIHRRSKDEAENATIWETVIDKLKKEGVSESGTEGDTPAVY